LIDTSNATPGIRKSTSKANQLGSAKNSLFLQAKNSISKEDV